MGKPLVYIETYLASEGYIAYQDDPKSESMALVLDNGLFFEFVPFNDNNFDNEGNINQNADALTIEQVEEGKEYALLISSVAGAWRYLLGDVVKFTNLERAQIHIVGRTKHYLSICGEHLSQDNMNRAIEMLEQSHNISIPEFTVAGLNYENMFQHKWWLGTNDDIDAELAAKVIDDNLKQLNDDYRVERIAAIRNVEAEILPLDVFYDYMKSKGKIGAQVKFPRVMKKHLPDWLEFLKTINK